MSSSNDAAASARATVNTIQDPMKILSCIALVVLSTSLAPLAWCAAHAALPISADRLSGSPVPESSPCGRVRLSADEVGEGVVVGGGAGEFGDPAVPDAEDVHVGDLRPV